MLRLYVRAPFAAFRTFTAGWYRPTAAFLTPSAAYGLVLNLAGYESRRDDGHSPMTMTAFGLPSVRLALGAVPGGSQGPYPSVQTLYQQLHNYPVGKDAGKKYIEGARGNKYNITPVRREFLADLRAFICLDGHPELEARVRDVLSGHPARSGVRYGLPFLGDNAFLIDRLEIRNSPEEAHWYRRLIFGDDPGIVPHTTRLTIWIDRQDMSKTRSGLYAPLEQPCSEVPEDAWTDINPPQNPR
jgi:CRISPR-associated protein Cas5t